MAWVDTLRRGWLHYRLADPHYAFLFDPAPDDEWVAIDCETTGFDVQRDRLVAVEAVRIVGSRLLTSERLELVVRTDQTLTVAAVRQHHLRERDVARGLPPAEAMERLLRYLGSRTLVGYFLDFDIAMLEREIRPLLGIGLPQPRIDVSALYYDYRNRQLPAAQRGGDIDLRFATLTAELGLPTAAGSEPFSDAVIAALAFLKLRRLLAGD